MAELAPLTKQFLSASIKPKRKKNLIGFSVLNAHLFYFICLQKKYL